MAKRCLTDGSPITDEALEIKENGQQKDYVVLCPEDREKGYVRPLRFTYIHKTCMTTTKMGQAIAETYARDPSFYGSTFCVCCKHHFPLDQFFWEGTNEQVGS